MVTDDRRNKSRFLCLKCRHVAETLNYGEHVTNISSCPKCGSEFIFEEKSALRLEFVANVLIKKGKIKRWNDA